MNIFQLQDEITNQTTRIKEADQQIRSATFLISKLLEQKIAAQKKLDELQEQLQQAKRGRPL